MPVKLGADPVIGVSDADLEKALRVDFKPSLFDESIEIKGYRIAWQRATFCPCTSNNDQTQQPDPNCVACKGKGWLYFKPTGYVADTTRIGSLDSLQTLIATAPDTVVIRGLLTNLKTKLEPYDKVGPWKSGDSQITVRYQNKLGYYDRLTNLDSTIVYTEVLTVGKVPQANLKTRYPIVAVNLIRSLVDEFDETDLDVVNGEIVWKPSKAPVVGTKITVHYHCYPTWVVVDHPHTTRSTWVAKKIKTGQTPTGDFLDLPLNAAIQYEFLPI